MSTPVITVNISDKGDEISALMRAKKVGSVIVLNHNSNPVGVITERDIVERIASRNLKPSGVKAEEVMSKPLKTIDSKASITDASKIMRSLGVRRLMVVEGSKLVGIVSSDDIVRITPELITIISEESSIGKIRAIPQKTGIVGRCNSCDQWSNNLKEHEGIFLCDECIEET